MISHPTQNLRAWRREFEGAWVKYQFNVQVALVTAQKLPGNWTPDQPTPPCPPPPSVTPLSDADASWDDNSAWERPPNFWKYWCSRDAK